MPSPTDCKHSPVFVMGCHSSGANLLYDMLLSPGGFAMYCGRLADLSALEVGEEPTQVAESVRSWGLDTPLARIADKGRMGIAESDAKPDAKSDAK